MTTTTSDTAALARAADAIAASSDVTAADRRGAVALIVALDVGGTVDGARAALAGFDQGGAEGLALLKRLTAAITTTDERTQA